MEKQNPRDEPVNRGDRQRPSQRRFDPCSVVFVVHSSYSRQRKSGRAERKNRSRKHNEERERRPNLFHDVLLRQNGLFMDDLRRKGKSYFYRYTLWNVRRQVRDRRRATLSEKEPRVFGETAALIVV